MKNSLSMVAMIGVMGMLVIMCMYFYVVSEHTDAGRLARTANKIKEVYALEDVEVRVDMEGTRIMTIEYTTRKDSGFDSALQKSEMTEIGTLALTTLSDVDQKKVRTVAVRRCEIRGGGCFRNEYYDNLDLDNPFRPKHR